MKAGEIAGRRVGMAPEGWCGRLGRWARGLAERAAEAEQLADQSTRRFEDLARKLGEIAGLASQLGAGKR